MENENVSTPGRNKRRTAIGFWIVSSAIVVLLLGYVVWDHWPHEVDAVTAATPNTINVYELRRALNRLEAPKGSQFTYGDSVDNQGVDGEVLFVVNPLLRADTTKFTLDELTLPLPKVLAIVKASTFEWSGVRFLSFYDRPSGRIILLDAKYSRATLTRMNLSKFSSARSLLEAADSQTEDPSIHWAGQ